VYPEDCNNNTIGFSNGAVSFIYSNPEGQLNSWPSNFDDGATIRTGDNLATLYDKLTVLNNNVFYAKFFKRIYQPG
jgi:hypothetical protein